MSIADTEAMAVTEAMVVMAVTGLTTVSAGVRDRSQEKVLLPMDRPLFRLPKPLPPLLREQSSSKKRADSTGNQ